MISILIFFEKQMLPSEEHRHIWLGSTDIDNRGIWKWGDGTKVDSPGHWNKYVHVPGANGPAVEVQDCMCIGWASSDKWDDQPCTKKQMYACQFDLNMWILNHRWRIYLCTAFHLYTEIGLYVSISDAQVLFKKRDLALSILPFMNMIKLVAHLSYYSSID